MNAIEFARRNADQVQSRVAQNHLVHVVKYLLQAKGDRAHAHALAQARNALPQIVEVLKAPVAGGSIGGWGAEISSVDGMIAAFIESLNNVGAFDTLLPSMRRIPFRTRIAIVTVGATAATIGEGRTTPISKLTLEGRQLDEKKAVVMLAASQELLNLAGAESAALFGRELRFAIAKETDREFIADITDGLSPIASKGGTAVAIRQDIAAAFAEIDTDASSNLAILIEATTAKAWATKTTSTGAEAFPGMTPQGGVVCGVPAVVSDGLDAGTMVVVDANQIGAGAGTIELGVSRHGTVELEDAPNSPASASATLTSFWQSNLVGLKAVRYFGSERLRDGAVAVVEGLSYAGNSPE